MTWKTRKKNSLLASIVCWELNGDSHIFRGALFPCHPPGRALLLTGAAVHGGARADGVAAAPPVVQPAVGDTLVLLADTRCKRSAAVSRAPRAGSRAPRGIRAPPPDRADKAAPHRPGVACPHPPCPPKPSPPLPSRARGEGSLHSPGGADKGALLWPAPLTPPRPRRRGRGE